MKHNEKYPNPFFTTCDIPDSFFCDRKNESEELKRLITNGNNVLLTSPRRMGKSGLVHHVFNDKEIREGYYTFYIDIYETSCLEEFVQKLGREIVGKLSGKGFDAINSFIRTLSSLRGSFTVDPSTGLPSFSVGIGDIVRPEITVDEIFNYLEKADKRCIVAIDEFQQIANYEQSNVEAFLRSKIQLMRNTAFIFSGSEKSLLSEMFFSHTRPFYQSTTMMSLRPIERTVYVAFAKQMFAKYGKQIDQVAVEDTYDLLQGYTFYLQRAMNESFSLLPDGKECDTVFILSCIDGILNANEDLYKDILASLTPNQRAVLSSIAKNGIAQNIMSEDFARSNGLGSISSIQSSVRSLLKKQLITRDAQKRCYLDDKFMELWLIRQFGYTLAYRMGQVR